MLPWKRKLGIQYDRFPEVRHYVDRWKNLFLK